MTSHRCAACGSPNVVIDTQAGGVSYNYKKGIVGTVVLGVGGSAAGIESKTQNVFKCQDCGITLTYEMPEKLRNAIDLGLVSEAARDFLYVEGIGQLSWGSLKRQYKNIEEGFADRIIADRANRQLEGLLSYATATQEEFDKAVDLIVDFERRLNCNASIFLPDDAFSDTNPMTLIEYYAWQDAIALFIENAAKYLSDLLADYRGFSKYNMKTYFAAYLYEKIRIEYGHLPVFTGYKHCEDFKKYASENPFVLYFADKYFQKTWMPFGTTDKKVLPWDPDHFADILRERDLMRCPSMVDIFYEFKDKEGEEISVNHYVPRYIVKDGRIGFWYGSNPPKRKPETDDIMEDYFTIYAEKRTEFESKVATHKQLISDEGASQDKIKSLESLMAGNETSIKTKKSEIVKLQKSIFGKKSALAKAALLEEEIKQLESKNVELKDNISKLKKQLEQLEDEWLFYEQLVSEMDYFIAWRWVEDANT